ncbi:MAG TPA: ATP-dependent Clp protease adaptor ClpS [Rhodothermales bacterium]|nr:ATP-dependent Clp protease adaptor ClpS [Rhodothermales bacterium]
MLSPPQSALTESDVAVETVPTDRTGLDHPWRVILFNDDVHTFDEVIHQLVKATGCSIAVAEGHAWTVHTHGKAIVFEDDLEPCLRVQSILREIELITELRG